MSYKNEIIKKRILEILSSALYELNNPRLQNITFSDIKLSNDFSYAKVYYIAHAQGAKAALNKSMSKFRTYLAKGLKLKKIPLLEFIADGLPEYTENIEKLIKLNKASEPVKYDENNYKIKN